jgi:dihydroxy-acid dehydratase
VRDGDRVTIDIPARRLELDVPAPELAGRKAGRQGREALPEGLLSRYAALVGSASEGAVLGARRR